MGGSEIFCKNLAINLKTYLNIDSDILTSDFYRKGLKIEQIETSKGNINIFYKKFLFNLFGKNPIVNIYKFLKRYYLNYDIIHIHSYIFVTSVQCAILKKFKKFPLVLHIHGGVETPYYSELKLLEKTLLIFKEKIYDNYIGKIPIENSDAIISVSKNALTIIKKKFNLNQNLNFNIPIGINTEKFRYNKNLERKYITFIGRLSYVKGFDIFLKIAEKLYEQNRNLKFLVVGEGPLKKFLLQIKKELPIKYISKYSYENMENIYNISKMILITSRFEGLPTIILESFSCRTPVISTNVGGISEVISNNENGILYDISNYNKIINLILYLVKNENILEKMGYEGQKKVLKEYSWKKVTSDIANIYDLVLDKYT